MKKRLLKLTCLIMLLTGSVYAQKVTGKVTSETDGTPMPGVSILLKGTSTGTATDSDGSYTLNVSDLSNGTLVFSFIGFVTKEVPTQGRSVVDVALAEDATQLSEVVVTALGISRETKTLVYATQQVKPSQLTEVRDANNVINSLQGKIANAVITQGSGGPGSGVSIVLRGNRSMAGSSNALIVIDGVPIINGTNGTINSDFGGLQGSDGASNINPDDIESMTILRGASAGALYGKAAGNGVIVITTKKGAKDKVSVTINSGITTERPFVFPNFQNEYGQGNSGVFNVNSGESWGPKLDGTSKAGFMGGGEQRPYSAQEDNVKDFFRTGVTLNNSVGISGGSEKMQTYLSYTNNRVQGILPKNDLVRHSINLRVSNQIGKKLKTDAKLNYILQNIDSKYETGESALSPTLTIYQIPRNVNVSDAETYYQSINNLGIPVQGSYPVINPALYQNPYWIVNNTRTDEVRNRIMGFLSAEYAITDWLKLSGRGNVDRYTDVITRQFNSGTVGISGAGGAYNRTEIIQQQYWFDAMLEGKNKLTNDLKIDYRLGTIIQDSKFYQLNNSANGLNVTNKFGLNFASNPVFSEGAIDRQTQSVFGQVNIAFKEAVFLDASIRRDWDSPLGAPHWYDYPSIGVSAILSDLLTIPDAISFLKLHVNYAAVGNGGLPQLRFNTFNYSPGGSNGFIFRSGTRAIPDLKNELVKSLEIGLEAKFMENRLGLQFAYYKSNTTNQLFLVPAPVASGFSNQYINAGDIQNQGIELVINGTPLKQGALTWDVNFNLGVNRNKIIDLHPTTKEIALGGGFGRSASSLLKEGASFGDMTGFFWRNTADVLDVNGKVISHSTSGTPIVTAAGLPLSSVTSGEQLYLGNSNPKATLGLTNTLTYNKFSLRLLIDGRIGGTIMDGTEMFLAYSGIPEVTSQYREGGWVLGGRTLAGAEVTTAINSQAFWTTASGGRYGSAEFFTYDATNFRVRELSIGYTIPVPDNSVFKTVRISAVARNLFFLYRGYSRLEIPGLEKRKMAFDPDMSLGNGNWQGISYGTLPSTRSLGFNLQLTF